MTDAQQKTDPTSSATSDTQNACASSKSTEHPPISKELHSQIQSVIDGNNRTEFLLMGGTSVLFLLGAVAVVFALVNGEYIWTLPSAGISAFLYWPYLRIEKLRNRNIALASAAALISNLPPAEAAMEIQKLIEKLFQEGR
ncbi:hypothetical protein [Thioclava electrotropha]|uniref:Uncharacterized protein n=1 Tax=Thioclava electrotropha TaxID=1549850 RepID=A0ABX6YQ51_9RHOB|nr:hypothetical protein [Thioclava electrotropha]QPZ89687.1 hypothetical protein AKL02_001500 [Thioclava electrotropha]